MTSKESDKQSNTDPKTVASLIAQTQQEEVASFVRMIAQAEEQSATGEQALLLKDGIARFMGHDSSRVSGNTDASKRIILPLEDSDHENGTQQAIQTRRFVEQRKPKEKRRNFVLRTLRRTASILVLGTVLTGAAEAVATAHNMIVASQGRYTEQFPYAYQLKDTRIRPRTMPEIVAPKTQQQIMTSLETAGPYQFAFPDGKGGIETLTFYSWGGMSNQVKFRGSKKELAGTNNAVLLPQLQGVEKNGKHINFTYKIEDKNGKSTICIMEGDKIVGFFNPNGVQNGDLVFTTTNGGKQALESILRGSRKGSHVIHDTGTLKNNHKTANSFYYVFVGPFGQSDVPIVTDVPKSLPRPDQSTRGVPYEPVAFASTITLAFAGNPATLSR